MNRVIRQSHRLWEPEQAIPLEPFAGDGPKSPARFVVDFIRANIRHQYGFALNSSTVLEEWLHVYPKGHKQTWFNRKAGKPISFSEKLAGENKVIEQLTRNNSLFLSAAAQNSHEMLLPIYNWFWNSLTFVLGDRSVESIRTAEMCNDGETRDLIARLLRVADLGIADLTVDEEREEFAEKGITSFEEV